MSFNSAEHVECYNCPQCSQNSIPDIETANENTDADGNRGMKIIYVECPWCGHKETVSIAIDS